MVSKTEANNHSEKLTAWGSSKKPCIPTLSHIYNGSAPTSSSSSHTNHLSKSQAQVLELWPWSPLLKVHNFGAALVRGTKNHFFPSAFLALKVETETASSPEQNTCSSLGAVKTATNLYYDSLLKTNHSTSYFSLSLSAFLHLFILSALFKDE